MLERLGSTMQLDASWQAALPPASTGLKVSVADGLRVLAFRHLVGGAGAVNEVLAAHRLPHLPAKGTCLGSDPCLVWAGSAESLLLTANDQLADDLLDALRPGCQRLACVLDQSAAWTLFEMNGKDVDHLLPRLLDASAIPRNPGQVVRARFRDINAVVMRMGPERVVLAVERPLESYAAQCIGQAWSATQG